MENFFIILAAVAGLAWIIRLLFVHFVKNRDRGDDFVAAARSAMNDDDFIEAITGEMPAFSYERLYRRSDGPVREVQPTSVLRDLPAYPAGSLTRLYQEPAEVEPADEYITGKAVRIIRRAEEERLEWHWDTLAGTWQPPAELARSLDFDSWLRVLLEDREEVAA